MYGGSGIRPARSSSSSTGSSPWKCSSAEPSSAFSTTDAATPSPKSIVSPARARFALRRNACHSRGPSRLCRVAPMLASPRVPFELRGDDLGVVEHQHVAGLEQLRQVEHLTVGDRRPVDDQQPRRIARPRRPQRNAVGGKLEIEKVDRRIGAPRLSRRCCALHNFGRLLGRLARRDLVDRVHARNHPAEDRVIAVEARVGANMMKNWLLALFGVLGARRRRPFRAGTACW